MLLHLLDVRAWDLNFQPVCQIIVALQFGICLQNPFHFRSVHFRDGFQRISIAPYDAYQTPLIEMGVVTLNKQIMLQQQLLAFSCVNLHIAERGLIGIVWSNRDPIETNIMTWTEDDSAVNTIWGDE